MKILLIVPDGVAIRNYLYSSFVKELNKNGAEVTVYHQISEAAIVEIKKTQTNIQAFVKIPKVKESIKARVLRESLCYARLLKNKKILKNNSILSFWNKNQKGIKQNVLYRLAEIFGFFLSKSNKHLLKMDMAYNNAVYKSSNINLIYEDFRHLSPDLVLNLHQRSPVSAPIIEVAKIKNIKTATIIFSWDNVPKARLISRYDSYFVWSTLMKKELSLLYPEINQHTIKVFGSPQFEFYKDDSFYKTKENFFSTYGLDINKKTICYSANDKSLPYDPNYLEDICEALLEIEEKERPQIIFRICPVDKSDRFKIVLEKYKKIIVSVEPDWRTEAPDKEVFTSIYPAYNDVSLLLNTVKHSDLVINMGSTMALDFAVLNKPCLYLNYDPVAQPKISTETIFNFQHFKSMDKMEAVGWINKKTEIKLKILDTIKNPNLVGKHRLQWLNTVVENRNTASREIAKYVTNGFREN